MSFRRGFKSDAERLAEELRRRLGVRVNEQMDLQELATILKARIVPADSLVPLARLAELKAIQDDAFSACTFTVGSESVIVFNPLNIGGRRNSDIAHELSHLA